MKRLAIAVTVLALACVGGWFWFDRIPLPSNAAPKTDPANHQSLERTKRIQDIESPIIAGTLDPAMRSIPRFAETVAGKTYDAADWPALPAIDVPVLAVFDTLRARALKGDSGAACRLTVDLNICRAVMPHRQRLERGNTVPNLVPFAPNDAAGQLKLLQRCQGLDERHLREQYAMLKRAALGGHELSLGYYLSGELFRNAPGANIDFLDDYRAEAPGLFESALQQGSMAAMVLPMAAQYGAPTPFLPEALSNNRFEIESLAIMMQLVRPKLPFGGGRNDGKRELEQLRKRSALSPEQFAAAERLAHQRAQDWYGDPARAKALGEFAATLGSSRGSTPDPNRLCQVGYLPPIEPREPMTWQEAPEAAGESP